MSTKFITAKVIERLLGIVDQPTLAAAVGENRQEGEFV